MSKSAEPVDALDVVVPTGNVLWRRIIKDRLAVIAFVILAVIALMAVFAPLIAPFDPYDNNLRNRLKPPGAEHWFGTDVQGRDLFSRLLYGIRMTLLIGLSGVAFGGVIGAALGVLAAYYRWLDGLIMRIVDILLSFPSILFGLALAAITGPGMTALIIALSIAAIPTVARIARGTAISVMQNEYMEAGRALGLPDRLLIWRYLVLNCLSTVFVYLTLQFGQTILLGAALSFLGLGAQPPTAELGTMAAEGRDFLFIAPHISTIPSVTIFLIVLMFNVVGDAMRDALDPRLRR
ncbi:MAG: ABC transporter permease [Pseudomonadota bacterium]